MLILAVFAGALVVLLGIESAWSLHGRKKGASSSDGTAPPPAPGPVARSIVRVLMYVVGPLRLLLKHEIVPARATAPLTPAEFSALPESVQRYITQTETTLQQIGFGSPVRMCSEGASSVKSFGSLLEHPDHIVLATVSDTLSTRGQGAEILFLRSDVADGTVVVTTNGRVKRRFPRRAGYDALSFPDFSDPVALLELHRFRVADRAGDTPRRTLSRAPDPLAYQRRELVDTFEHFLQIGYYRRSRADTLRLTVKGAVCTTWRGMFPWMQISEASDERRRQRVLARYNRAKRLEARR
jgi:hypothetical protein